MSQRTKSIFSCNVTTLSCEGRCLPETHTEQSHISKLAASEAVDSGLVSVPSDRMMELGASTEEFAYRHDTVMNSDSF